jgi:exopolyphosphatase/guanosine-5'-triphosphate,3'-diphosphate pyrophosphatase
VTSDNPGVPAGESGGGRRLGAVDVGTNSVRLLVAEFDEESVHVLDESGEVTRLGAALGRASAIDPADSERTWTVLERCVARAREFGVESLDVVGTEVFRAAENGRDVAAEFSSRLGHAVRILSTDDEAEAAYLGVVGWNEHPLPGVTLVFDVGGGSTQIIVGEGISLSRARSVPIGALRLTETFLGHDPPRPAEVTAARKEAAGLLKPLAGFVPRSAGKISAIGVGGTACATGAWVHKVVPYDKGRVEGVVVRQEALKAALEEWLRLDVAGRMEQGGIREGRARILPGGGLILEALLETLGIRSFGVSTYGIRHGIVLRRFLMA